MIKRIRKLGSAPWSSLRRRLRVDRWGYFVRGLSRKWSRRRCPCCGSEGSVAAVVDHKFPYALADCQACRILYRFPYESAHEMAAYYQRAYRQEGITTDLPSELELARLMASNFSGTERSFDRVVDLFNALGLPRDARALDFGASWGYGAFQLRRAGYQVAAFEISEPRAAFGAKLGLQIHTRLAEVTGPFDVVYSSHVLEHVPSPLQTLREQLALIGPGGYVIAHTPNGSLARRQKDPGGFHRQWGLAHPVLLSEQFVVTNFSRFPAYLAAVTSARQAHAWDRTSTRLEDLAGDELLIVLRKPIQSC
jgi:2-polyprenyl-3-methyl-5-hydroxy-6-metoxy-1,4-benzoquinol methylase